MFIVTNGTLAIVLCIVTMLCWGSWGNTQKLAGKSWRYELFYWDYCVGILLFSVLLGLTFGSNGEQGQPFVQNLLQMDGWLVLSALAGGAIFNAANISSFENSELYVAYFLFISRLSINICPVVSEFVSGDKGLIQVFLIAPEDSLFMIVTFLLLFLFLNMFISYPLYKITSYMDSH